MSYLDAILLSLVEGFSEFLPISSTAHLIITSRILGIEPTAFTKSFEIFVQLGAILTVISFFPRKFDELFETAIKLFLAFLPTGIAGVIFYKLIKTTLLENVHLSILMLLSGGIVIILVEWLYSNGFFRKNSNNSRNGFRISFRQALLIGLFQSLSILPGVSRAAACIIGGMIVGLKRAEAAKFSFLLALPTILAASVFDLSQSWNFSISEIKLLATGFLVSFLTAFFVVRILIIFVSSHSFLIFGFYRIAVSFLFWLIFS